MALSKAFLDRYQIPRNTNMGDPNRPLSLRTRAMLPAAQPDRGKELSITTVRKKGVNIKVGDLYIGQILSIAPGNPTATLLLWPREFAETDRIPKNMIGTGIMEKPPKSLLQENWITVKVVEIRPIKGTPGRLSDPQIYLRPEAATSDQPTPPKAPDLSILGINFTNQAKIVAFAARLLQIMREQIIVLNTSSHSGYFSRPEVGEVHFGALISPVTLTLHVKNRPSLAVRVADKVCHGPKTTYNCKLVVDGIDSRSTAQDLITALQDGKTLRLVVV